jgi:hypothetical protein
MSRLGWIGSPSPEQQLWVEWNERVVVLGDFAACFDPQDRINSKPKSFSQRAIFTEC